jgi:hypothetical protein
MPMQLTKSQQSVYDAMVAYPRKANSQAVQVKRYTRQESLHTKEHVTVEISLRHLVGDACSTCGRGQETNFIKATWENGEFVSDRSMWEKRRGRTVTTLLAWLKRDVNAPVVRPTKKVVHR